MLLPPLSLYIHIPWCIQKCPYCDFNSHTLKQSLPEQEYVQHLLNDLHHTLIQTPWLKERALHSIFIGGGTPSLLSGQAVACLLTGIAQQMNLPKSTEITLEANPGAIDSHHFAAYRSAGVNRISLGIQSFNSTHLQKLGRIHNGIDAKAAIELVNKLAFPQINLDIMHGLPQQTISEALQDLEIALQFKPTHLSWYQLTIEPNTLFASKPPTLPNDDLLWSIFHTGQQYLTDAHYQQYEVSAYATAKTNRCQHNLNYWQFGDYIGIGCGAHGKLTDLSGGIIRTVKTRHPKGYLQGQYHFSQQHVPSSELPFEFFMNRLRLFESIPRSDFTRATGLSELVIRGAINQSIAQEFLLETETHWETTQHGRLFLNNLLELFLSH